MPLNNPAPASASEGIGFGLVTITASWADAAAAWSDVKSALGLKDALEEYGSGSPPVEIISVVLYAEDVDVSLRGQLDVTNNVPAWKDSDNLAYLEPEFPLPVYVMGFSRQYTPPEPIEPV